MNKVLKNIIAYICLMTILPLFFQNIIKSDKIYNNLGIIFIYLITGLVIGFLNYQEIKKMFKKYKKNWQKNIKKNILTWIIGFLIMMFCNYLVLTFINNKLTVNEKLVREMYNNYLIASTFINILIIPFLEEIVFRLSFNEIKNKYLYLITSSFIFAFFHVIGSLESILSIFYILPYFAIGITLGLVYYRSQNIFDSILIHAIHNLVVLICYFIF